jgi:hypothetical protein
MGCWATECKGARVGLGAGGEEKEKQEAVKGANGDADASARRCSGVLPTDARRVLLGALGRLNEWFARLEGGMCPRGTSPSSSCANHSFSPLTVPGEFRVLGFRCRVSGMDRWGGGGRGVAARHRVGWGVSTATRTAIPEPPEAVHHRKPYTTRIRKPPFVTKHNPRAVRGCSGAEPRKRGAAAAPTRAAVSRLRQQLTAPIRPSLAVLLPRCTAHKCVRACMAGHFPIPLRRLPPYPLQLQCTAPSAIMLLPDIAPRHHTSPPFPWMGLICPAAISSRDSVLHLYPTPTPSCPHVVP